MLTNFSLPAKACSILAVKALSFYGVLQVLILLGLFKPSFSIFLMGLICIVIFVPTGSYVTYEYIMRQRQIKQMFDDKLQAIERSNILVVFDEKGTIIEANENFCFAMGYKTHEIIGEHHKLLVAKETACSHGYRNFWEQLRLGEHIEGDFSRVTKSGDLVWLSCTYTPVRAAGGAVYQIIKIAQNVTEEYTRRSEMRQQNIYLEHAAKILRHDMHSGINTYMPRGIKGLERRLTEEQIKTFKLESPMRLLKEGLQHTQKVYEGVKEFTNLVKKDAVLHLETKDLRTILLDYLSMTAYADQVVIDWLPSIPINEPLFCTAIDNFIRNGLKYNDSETKVVAITMVDDYHLAVIDNGRGMTQKEFMVNIKPYVRGNRNKSQESGSGLGLNISISILEEHGFSVTCEEQVEGTMMKVRIK